VFLNWIQFRSWLQRKLCPCIPRRKALLIGNSAYRNGMKQLANPCKDARDMRDLLRRRGFARADITLLEDATLQQMRKAVELYVSSARRDDVLFFYFAGHGAEDEWKLHMFGVDSENSGFPLLTLLREINPKRVLSLIVLDCCRSPSAASTPQLSSAWNPSNISFGLPSDARARDTARLEPDNSGDFLIAYGCDPATSTRDGSTNGPWTGCLLKQLRVNPWPDSRMTFLKEISNAADDLRQRFKQQRPWVNSTNSSKVHDFIL